MGRGIYSLRGSAGCGAGAHTRAPYVAAECIYAYIVKNGGTVDTAHFQLRCRQAVHSRVDKFRIAAWETIQSISHFNRNCKNNNDDKSGRTVDRALLFCALQADFADFSVVCFVGLVYPLPHFGLLSRGEAVRDEQAHVLACGL